MLLPKFDFHEPATIAEACQMMAEFGSEARLIAGGTDLMVNMKHKVISPNHVVSLSRIDDLKKLDLSDSTVKIGACFTVAEITESEEIGKKLSALRTGARALGSPLVRNRATIGGNLGTARPAADLPPSLMVYDAKVVLTKSSGEREVSLDSFFKGPGVTEIQPDEILTEIRVDVPPPHAGAGYINLGIRQAQDCNLVNVASYIALDGPDGTIQSARVVMGCVGPTHLRASSAEKLLIGEKPSDELFEKAGEAAMGDCTPIDDFRGSAQYKKAMVGVLTKRTLGIALKEAKDRG
ncbi:FAD binding domain-containing protein [Desulfonema magnum]|uniref:4-hydroxybenzoyl-CoA reductase, beta subunit n=1 Tax=Desulfonema magnum TaxID=45655 RepID=A0A975BX01_9BACT|nr:xanthine dehydrogenase family protein subunit M [Desulfonema magnum]QTA92902.1 4-hydroxybenzoyl-CoA reductase, beta subunit [Desulfonema magnum]